MPLSEEEAVEKFKEFLKAQGKDADHLTEEQIGFAKIMFSQRPFIEGAWMTKHDGTYYLQYAGPGTEYNVYGDGVYESDSPLGPFRLAKNNPYSYKPGGFLRGAGHGSTMEDRYGNWWHTATMQISKTTIWSVASASGGQASTKMVFCSAISSSATGRWQWSRQKKTHGQNRSGIS